VVVVDLHAAAVLEAGMVEASVAAGLAVGEVGAEARVAGSVAAAEFQPAAAPLEAGRKLHMHWLRNMFPGSLVRRCFPAKSLAAVRQAVTEGERQHRGEICLAVEGALTWQQLLARRSARERAVEIFSQLKVWDTRENTGVLVYVLLAERAIEIVADRGIAERIDDAVWSDLCERMRVSFAGGAFEAGAIAAVGEISALLAEHFPADGRDNPDELPNRPVLL